MVIINKVTKILSPPPQSYVKYNIPYFRLPSVTQTEIQTFRVIFETREHPKLQIHICGITGV